MDIDPSWQKLGLGGTSAGLLYFLGAKLWRVFNHTVTENRKDQAEAALYESLRHQIESLNTEMENLKLRHAKERDEQDTRISKLEDEMLKQVYKRRQAQSLALEAYTSLMVFCTGNNCPNLDTVKTTLRKIIDG